VCSTSVLQRAAIVAVVLAGIACPPDEGPVVISSVNVTSPIGDRLAVDRTVQLTAAVRDAGGAAVNTPVTWRSSAPSVATVSNDGLVVGATAGDVTISAEAGGVSGSLAVHVLGADLAGIAMLLNDGFFGRLVSRTTTPVYARVGPAVDQCRAGILQGNFVVIDSCIAVLRAEAAAATSPDDRVSLGTAVLFINHAARLLGY
jgi:hypothetical protein